MPGGNGAPAVERVRNGVPAVVRGLSSALDRGENAAAVVHVARDIDPNDPSNIPYLLAVE